MTTSAASDRVSAPGKIVLLGDYAVLEGGLALVAAVDRRAEGWIEPEAPGSEVVDAVLREAQRRGITPVPRGVRIDTSGFYEPTGEKLGIGSSAAVAVVAAALASGRGDEESFDIALCGHRAAAGGVGSGIDLAASFHGGVVATRNQPAPVQALPSHLPGLGLSVLYANRSASTATLVRACRACPRWASWMAVMKPLAEQGIDAWRAGQSSAFLSVVARYGRAMAGLGKDAGVAIVTETIEATMRYAEEGGGAAKASGAGGGDVVVLFSSDPELAPRVAEKSGARLLSLAVDPIGLRRA